MYKNWFLKGFLGPGTCLILFGALFWPLLWSQNPKILVLGPNPSNLGIFLISLIFGIPIFRTLFEKNRSPMAPQGKPLCGKGSHMDPLHVRFSSQTVESSCFCQSNSTFSWKPCFLRSSVWGQFRQVFVFPPRLRGVVGNLLGIYSEYALIGFNRSLIVLNSP